MTAPKTIRVKRNQASDSTNVGEFASGHSTSEGPWTEITVPGHFECDELDITIAPVKSLKQQRREARERAVSESRRTYHLETVRVVDAIEQADAEFDREREMERRRHLERLRDAIEAIYRGER